MLPFPETLHDGDAVVFGLTLTVSLPTTASDPFIVPLQLGCCALVSALNSRGGASLSGGMSPLPGRSLTDEPQESLRNARTGAAVMSMSTSTVAIIPLRRFRL
jgi:hypothetical protein